jgi:GNAT superfamily N-acetyltransferase
VTEGDLEVLVDHRHRMWSEIGNHTEREIAEHDSRYRAWALSRIRSGEVVGVVAAAPGGSVIASGCVWFRPDQPRPQLPSLISPYILSMYTAPDWRGRGVASRIVRDLVSVCRKAGYPNVDLHASKYGRSVYSRLRFDRTWEMRFWIDPRIRRRRARLRAKSQKRGSKGLDRAR